MEKLKSISTVMKNSIIMEEYMSNISSDIINAELEQLSTIYEGRVMLINNNFKVVKDTYSMSEGKECLAESVIRCMRGQNVIQYSEENGYIEIATALSYVNNSNQGNVMDGVLLMSFSIEDILNDVSDMDYFANIMLLVFCILLISISIYITYKISLPFYRMKRSIDEIKLGQFDGQIDTRGYTEMQAIGEAFEHVMERMRTLDESRQEFVSNVSHELKTPITSVKVLADSLLMQENVPVEMYREFLGDIALEIDREDKIISDLLNLVKLEKKSADLNISQINVNEMVELVLKRLRPIAQKRNIELVFESFRPVIAEVDEVKMTMVISNLVENAVKYNILDGWVRVSLNADHKYFYLKVADSGIGIPKESQSHVFERFYRVDKTRSRETGGTGLGLAITYNGILMHKGDIKLYSKEGEGTTFTVKIPLIYVP
jgi:signal transduction histidine kinase